MKKRCSPAPLIVALTIAALLAVAGCGGSDPDERAPTLTFDGISATTTSRTRTLSGTVEPGARVDIAVGETVIPAAVTGGDWTADVTLQPGVNLVSVSASDATGNLSLFALSLLYDAVSIETYTTPIPTTTLLVDGLVDPTASSLTLTLTAPDGTETSPVATLSGDSWSATISGLQEDIDNDGVVEPNILLASATIPGLADPVEVSVPIVVDATTPVLEVAFDQGLTTVAVPSQTLSGTFSTAAEGVTLTPTPAEGSPVGNAQTGIWIATFENLNVGKNPLTATVVDQTSGLASVARTVLIVDQAPPLLDNVTPAENGIEVPIDSVVTVVFDSEMDPATIDATSFSLSDGGAVSATVDYDAATRTATLTPSASLTAGTAYSASLAATVADTAGNPLSQAYTWQFTTAAAAP